MVVTGGDKVFDYGNMRNCKNIICHYKIYACTATHVIRIRTHNINDQF